MPRANVPSSLPSPPAWLVEMILAVLRHASVRAALADVLCDALPQRTERAGLLTSDELCESLKISRSKLDTMISDGLPHVMVGSVRRFDLAEVVAHLRATQQQQEKAA